MLERSNETFEKIWRTVASDSFKYVLFIENHRNLFC